MEATTQRIPSRISDSLLINWAVHELLYDHVSVPATMETRPSLDGRMRIGSVEMLAGTLQRTDQEPLKLWSEDPPSHVSS
jgi:hypothetical protein